MNNNNNSNNNNNNTTNRPNNMPNQYRRNGSRSSVNPNNNNRKTNNFNKTIETDETIRLQNPSNISNSKKKPGSGLDTSSNQAGIGASQSSIPSNQNVTSSNGMNANVGSNQGNNANISSPTTGNINSGNTNPSNISSPGAGGLNNPRGQVNRNNKKPASKGKNIDPLSNAISDKLNKLRRNKKKDNEETQSDKNAKTTSDNKTKNTSNKLANTLGNLGNIQNGLNTLKNKLGEGVSSAARDVRKKGKAALKIKNIVLFLAKLWPVLLGILIAIIIIIILIIILSLFAGTDREEIVIDTITLNYCDNVHVTWKELDENNVEVEKEDTMSSDTYLAYQMSLTDFHYIENEEVIKALSIIYRTNLYYQSNNWDSNTCEFELEQPYYDPSEDEKNQIYFDAISSTHNKVFTTDDKILHELEIDEDFTFDKTVDLYNGPAYLLSQDRRYYMVDWINENVPSMHIKQGTKTNSFSPWAAWYLAERQYMNYHSLLYRFYDELSSKSDIYNVIKIGGSDDFFGNFCSDIPLTETKLSREEFINYVLANVNNGAFKSNAGKIYDISVANNFNPEVVVIRAISEGFSPGGSTYNYWGIGCFNGTSECAKKPYPSFDAGVLAFINNIKSHNYTTAYQMMSKYSHIGQFWFNTSEKNTENTGLGGCYYYPYIKQYLSEERAAEVGNACVVGKWCYKGGSGDCLPTTDEDQSAYAKWQVSKMSGTRAQVFNITAEECSEEGNQEETGDLSTLGARVAKYAVQTYDPWSYSQAKRDQNGYVDCSSMVYRAYGHFGFRVFDSGTTAADIEQWCENHGKIISGGSLQPGDLIFFNTNSSYKAGRHHNIGHVSMYIGPGQQFAAHGEWINQKKNIKRPQPDQVSVTAYNGGGAYFCRPTK